MADTIKEFLVSLGFRLDESSWSRFQSTVESATLKARLFGDALEAVAKSVASAVARVADDFESLFYASSRLGASVESIRAFEYAISQVGGTAAGAHSALKAFGDWMRTKPGAEDLVNSMGVATKDANGPIDRAKVLLAIGEKLSALSKQGPAGAGLASNYAAHLGGIDQDTLLALERDPRKFYEKDLGSEKSAGIGGPMAEAAVKFEQALRETYQRITTFAEGSEGKLFGYLTEPLEKFNTWLDANKDKINGALTNIATSAGQVGEKVLAAIQSADWSTLPAKIDAFGKSISGLSGGFSTFLGNLDETRKKIEVIAATLAGMRIGSYAGPAGTVVGGLIGLGFGVNNSQIMPQAKNKEGNPEYLDDPSSYSGEKSGYFKSFRDWLKATTNGVLGNDSGATPKPTTQHLNGAPLSEGNPMPVRVVGDGGGWLNWLKGALGISPADAAEAPGGGGATGGHAPSSLRRRGSSAGGDVTKFGTNVGGAAPGNTADAMRVAMDQLRKEGVAPAHLRSAAALLVGMGISESTLNPNAVHDGGTGFGIYGARLERRAAMFSWLAEHGYAKNSLEGQMRFMAHEAMTNPRFAKTRGILSNATPENVIGSAAGVTTNFEAPGPASWPQGPLNDRRPNVAKAYRAAPSVPATTPAPAHVGPTSFAPIGSGVGYNALASAPLGATSAPRTGGDRHMSSNITNHITVTSGDPDSAAAAVGAHLDRTASDVYRNLMGAVA